ncbi:uncharacterized protein F5891DRAFT_1014933 [Suillus fuscotomentosus]|uniref:Uncharacterized protein n=1 Tax=Suillus fuscotomentosus TaxID=1912939 RepID=A0AAD4HPR1_9AGAM|nr:uncharacterized protein F5891DRAFT_1014933 [Suillus fuscotomentosus]KAG1904453.1 hypothetical protein F5891DRAFT_1014933 [Suillus fuscotomentosus]
MGVAGRGRPLMLIGMLELCALQIISMSLYFSFMMHIMVALGLEFTGESNKSFILMDNTGNVPVLTGINNQDAP